ncbi:MAG: molybdopterin-guanine dinucleotide biosynthesis protein B, partial [Treponema sp.]|nr:molybdopterin-guanine dinucleotide biosynthesis protein B [Treponema sp.]
KNKAFLTLNGETFLSRLSNALNEFEEVLLSVGSASCDAGSSAESGAESGAEKYSGETIKMVEDIYPGCGPIGGIYSALRHCRSEYLLALSCDMPLFQKDLAKYMIGFVDAYHDAFVVVTRQECAQPQCAIYRRRAADILDRQIKDGNYRLIDALAKMRVKYIPLRYSIFHDDLAQGVNTQAEYAALLERMQGVPVVAVCGVKNSGKTTLLANVIPLLKARGLRVAVIKHDGHDFESDVPGTDSYRLRKAGACAAAVYSSSQYMIAADRTGTAPDFFAPFFQDADLILLEGGKYTAYPKIEIVRRGISQYPISDTETLIAICSDMDVQLGEIPTLPIDAYEMVAEIISKICL